MIEAEEILKEIFSATKRASSMGEYHKYLSSYDTHFLAGSIHNYIEIIYNEFNSPEADLVFILQCYYEMAKRINDFCDNNRVAEDIAAQYWLEYFTWFRECKFTEVNSLHRGRSLFLYQYVDLYEAFGEEAFIKLFGHI